MTRAAWRQLETIALVAIVAHSLAIGVLLTFFTRWGLEVGGWGPVEPLFFPRQAGVFHFVVATGYAVEFSRHRGVSLLLVAKAMAVLFLISMILLGHRSWTVWISMAGDAAMWLAMLLLHRWAR